MTTNSTEVTVTLTFKLEDVGQCFSFRGYDDRTYTASSATVAMCICRQFRESMPFIESYSLDCYDEDCDEDPPSVTADDFIPYGYQLKPIWQKEPRWVESWWERSEGTRMREDGCILVEDAETYEEACALVKAEIIKTLVM